MFRKESSEAQDSLIPKPLDWVLLAPSPSFLWPPSSLTPFLRARSAYSPAAIRWLDTQIPGFHQKP